MSKISAKVIADSVNPKGNRITTVEATFNRYILAELNTHRVFSRNSASSRAIPVSKVLKQVFRDPAIPISWGKNQAGMQSRVELSGFRKFIARKLFVWSRFPALIYAWLMTKAGLHKQVVNRILEPWVWHTVVITATEWRNFFKLRLHPDAQPEFQELAKQIKIAIDQSVPKQIDWGEWHLPYTDHLDKTNENMKAQLHGQIFAPRAAFVSAARCAAVSYVRQGEARNPEADVALTQRLEKGGHWSPFEHTAMATQRSGSIGNFNGGWMQLRKFYQNESGEQ